LKPGGRGKIAGGIMSPPARGRGLKHQGGFAKTRGDGSPPARGRGLKHIRRKHEWMGNVAPRAGAWIETSSTNTPAARPAGRPPRGGVD